MMGRPTFAAIIGHADDPNMLRCCIAHHLAIGVDWIFVSLNDDDPESANVAREFAASGNVRAARADSFSDTWRFFTAAKDVVMGWVAPDWLLFVDTDEFWLPAGGRIDAVDRLDSFDLLNVQRFNAPPVREGDGTLHPCATSDPLTALLIGQRRLVDADYLARNPETPWIAAKIGQKILVRPEFIAEVGRGAHGVVSPGKPPRTSWAPDVLVVHFPFTTEARFRAKISAIRTRLGSHGDRFEPGQAWHWRRWLAQAENGEIGAEFERQSIRADDVPALLAQGVLTTPARIFALGYAPCD